MHRRNCDNAISYVCVCCPLYMFFVTELKAWWESRTCWCDEIGRWDAISYVCVCCPLYMLFVTELKAWWESRTCWCDEIGRWDLY